jgi:hypothetical protein
MKSSMHSAEKSSEYAAGSLLTVTDLPVVEVAAILAETDRLERMPSEERARILAGAKDCVAVL